MDAIFARTSVREFTAQKVEDDKIDTLLRAAMAAPSAGNQQPWEFIVVTNEGLLSQLAQASPYAKPAQKAPLAIVVAANKDHTKMMDYWQQDLGAATQNILLEAVTLGLGGVWLGIAPLPERMEHVTNALSLPPQLLPYAIVPIGYPAAAVQPKDHFNPAYIHTNGYTAKD